MEIPVKSGLGFHINKYIFKLKNTDIWSDKNISSTSKTLPQTPVIYVRLPINSTDVFRKNNNTNINVQVRKKKWGYEVLFFFVLNSYLELMYLFSVMYT